MARWVIQLTEWYTTVGDGGGEKGIGGFIGNSRWNSEHQGRVYNGGLVLPPVEGGEQVQIMGWGVGMCQKANITVFGYIVDFL